MVEVEHHDRLCPDCGVHPGSAHEQNCDVARCLVDGGQRLMHILIVEAEAAHGGQTCGTDIWTGEWPGVTECEEFDLFATFSPGQGWKPCARGAPGAQHDLNTLLGSGRYEWDRAQLRWVERKA